MPKPLLLRVHNFDSFAQETSFLPHETSPSLSTKSADGLVVIEPSVGQFWLQGDDDLTAPPDSSSICRCYSLTFLPRDRQSHYFCC